MKPSKHTQGPWIAKEEENNGFVVYSQNESDTFEARVYSSSIELEKRNAKLIAAAPDLATCLIALKNRVKNELGCSAFDDALVKAAESVIIEALGGHDET